jgi:DNA-binding SARP family transcriptional activator
LPDRIAPIAAATHPRVRTGVRSRRPRRAPETTRSRLSLLAGFALDVDGQPVRLPLSAQRVVAFVALHERPLQRVFVAGNLWLDASEERANASLRTALWRLRQPGCTLVEATTTHVALAPGVEVDVREAGERARRVLRREEPAADDLAALCYVGDLLPDWYDDWVLIERERIRQTRLHALEALCLELTDRRRFAEATEAGLAAVAGEPLRESAHRALVRAHLAEGNPGEAIRQFRLLRRLLHDQLGLEPSAAMCELVEALPVS